MSIRNWLSVLCRRLRNSNSRQTRRANQFKKTHSVEALEQRSLLTAPVAIDDQFVLDEDGTHAAVNVLDNDSFDPNNTPITVTLESGVMHGTVDVDGNGNVLYTPEIDWSGTDTFVYRITDSQNDYALGSVTIQVNPTNDAPSVLAPPADLMVDEDAGTQTLWLDTVFADVDIGDAMYFSATGYDTNLVTVSVNGPGLQMTPVANASGSTPIQLSVTDSQGQTATTTWNVYITPVNDMPVVNPTTLSITCNEDDPTQSIDLANYFSDVEGPMWMLDPVGHDANLITATMSGAVLQLTPQPSQSGSTTLTVTGYDSDGATATLMIDISVHFVNDAPVVLQPSTSIVVDEDSGTQWLSLDTIIADPDIDDVLTFSATGYDSNLINVSIIGSLLEFTPVSNAHGSTSIQLLATDGQANSATTTVYIYVSPVNDDPVANPSTIDVTLNEDDVAQSVNLAVYFTDVDGSLSWFDAWGHDTNLVTASVSGTSLELAPQAGLSGFTTLMVTGYDAFGASATLNVNITVSPVNDAPVPQQTQIDKYVMAVDGPFEVSLLDGAFDAESDPLSVVIKIPPQKGTLQDLGGGVFQYQRLTEDNTAFEDVFTYTISDGTAESATVTVFVHAMEFYIQTALRDEDFEFDISGNITEDADGNIVDVTWDDGIASAQAITLTVRDAAGSPYLQEPNWMQPRYFKLEPVQPKFIVRQPGGLEVLEWVTPTFDPLTGKYYVPYDVAPTVGYAPTNGAQTSIRMFTSPGMLTFPLEIGTVYMASSERFTSGLDIARAKVLGGANKAIDRLYSEIDDVFGNLPNELIAKTLFEGWKDQFRTDVLTAVGDNLDRLLLPVYTMDTRLSQFEFQSPNGEAWLSVSLVPPIAFFSGLAAEGKLDDWFRDFPRNGLGLLKGTEFTYAPTQNFSMTGTLEMIMNENGKIKPWVGLDLNLKKTNILGGTGELNVGLDHFNGHTESHLNIIWKR